MSDFKNDAMDLMAAEIARLRAIAAAAALFDLELTDKDAGAIAAGPLVENHSKRPQESFDQSTRKREEALVKLAYGPDIERAMDWAKGVAEEASIPMELHAPLIS